MSHRSQFVHTGRIGALWLVALWAIAGCGDAPKEERAANHDVPTGSTSSKQLPEGGPCDLIAGREVANAFDTKLTKGSGREEDGPQCFLDFENEQEVVLHRGVAAAGGGTPTTFEGLAARQRRTSSMCVMDVWLTPGKDATVFGAIASPMAGGDDACDVAARIVRMIYEKLPK